MTRKLIVLAVLSLLAVVTVLPAAAAPEALSVNATVANQVCLSGDIVRVTLTATAESSSQPVGFAWDFTNNGTIDTRPRTNPTVTTTYPDEVNVTARVVARNAEGNTASDTVSFSTLRCEN